MHPHRHNLRIDCGKQSCVIIANPTSPDLRFDLKLIWCHRKGLIFHMPITRENLPTLLKTGSKSFSGNIKRKRTAKVNLEPLENEAVELVTANSHMIDMLNKCFASVFTNYYIGDIPKISVGLI